MFDSVFQNICVILLVNFVFYFKCLAFHYVSDDIPSSQRKEQHPKWKYWYLVLEGHLKSTPQIDHAITMVIHALVCVFIYTGFGTSTVSYLASLLFCVNPINNQASTWISGRGYAFSALGMIMMMTFPYLALPLLVFTTYSNAGFLAPLVFAGSEYSWILYLLPIAWWFHWKRFKLNVGEKIKQEMFVEDKKIHPYKLIIAVKTFGFYFIHAIIPFKTTFYHSYMQSMAGAGRFKARSINDRFFWFGLIIIGGILTYWFTHKWDMISYGLLWWCICIAPFCNFFRLNQEVGERYCYVGNVGLMYVLANFIINVLGKI